MSFGGLEVIYYSYDCGELCMYFCIYIIMCVYCVDLVFVCVWFYWWINVFWELLKLNIWGWYLICLIFKIVLIGNNILIFGYYKIGNLFLCSCVVWDVKNFVLYIIYGCFNYFGKLLVLIVKIWNYLYFKRIVNLVICYCNGFCIGWGLDLDLIGMLIIYDMFYFLWYMFVGG